MRTKGGGGGGGRWVVRDWERDMGRLEINRRRRRVGVVGLSGSAGQARGIGGVGGGVEVEANALLQSFVWKRGGALVACIASHVFLWLPLVVCD